MRDSTGSDAKTSGRKSAKRRRKSRPKCAAAITLVNACRLYGVDPEAALERTNRKFIRRFTAMEEAAAGQGRMLSDLTPDEQEALWQKAKQEER